MFVRVLSECELSLPPYLGRLSEFVRMFKQYQKLFDILIKL